VIFIVVKFKARPECSAEWLDRVRPFTDATRGEPGNLWFEWSRGVDDPHQFVLLEAFRDAEAGAAHVGSEHFRTALEVLRSLVAEVPEIVNVEVPGTGWSRLSEVGELDGGAS